MLIVSLLVTGAVAAGTGVGAYQTWRGISHVMTAKPVPGPVEGGVPSQDSLYRDGWQKPSLVGFVFLGQLLTSPTLQTLDTDP